MGHINLTPKQKEVLEFIYSYLDEKGYPPSLEEIAKNLKKSIPTIHQYIETLKNKGYIIKEKNVSRGISTKSDKIGGFILGRIAAGEPIEAVENPTPIEIPKLLIKTPGDYYALEVKGDSMIEEGILDQDLVLVKHQPTANVGDIIVAVINGSATLKKFGGQSKEGRIKLIPRNPSMEPFFVNSEDFEIRGKFIGLIRGAQIH